jgi:hypothetical protein
MIIFLLGFFMGFIFCFFLILLAFIIVREIIFKYGVPIKTIVERALDKFEDKTKNGTTIVFPETTKEIFDETDSKLSDLLKN